MAGHVPPHAGAAGGPDDLKTVLNRAIFMRESQQAALCYGKLIDKKPDFLLPVGLQHDLARLLELGNEPRLALHAYEQVLTNYESEPVFVASLRAAGHLAYRLKQYKKCRAYLERFLTIDPPKAERVDAENILKRLPDGKGLRDPAEYAARPEPSIDTDVGSVSSASAIQVQKLRDDSEVRAPDAARPAGDAHEREMSSVPFHQEEPPSTEQVAVEPKAAKPAKQRPEKKKEKKEAPEIASELWGAELYGSSSASATEVNVQELRNLIPDGNTDKLANFDSYGETPPLSIGARDVRRGATPPPLAQVPPPREPAEAAGWGPKEQAEPREWSGDSVFERWRGHEFAMLLPIGKRISLESVAEVLKAIEGLPDKEAKEAVLERKGLLREKLTYEEAIAIYPKIKKWRKSFLFIAIDSCQLPDMRHDVTKLEMLEPGLRMKTNHGVKKARWDNVRLISCGRLERQPTIDLFCNKTCQHFRLRDPQFEFASALEKPGSDASESCKRLLQLLVEKCPQAKLSHTVRNLLGGKTYRPQKFGSEDEFRRYNMCLLLTHYGQEVELRELFEQSQAGSRSGW